MKSSAILLLAFIATLALTTAVQADEDDNFEEGNLFSKSFHSLSTCFACALPSCRSLVNRHSHIVVVLCAISPYNQEIAMDLNRSWSAVREQSSWSSQTRWIDFPQIRIYYVRVSFICSSVYSRSFESAWFPSTIRLSSYANQMWGTKTWG